MYEYLLSRIDDAESEHLATATDRDFGSHRGLLSKPSQDSVARNTGKSVDADALQENI